MGLLLRLFPFYLVGNLHCLGMCGPLVMFIGTHQYRNSYFLGRIASFTLVGLIAGSVGAVTQGWLQLYRIPAFTSLALALLFTAVAIGSLFRLPLPKFALEGRVAKGVQHQLSMLMMRDHPFPIFLFGFCTIALPCGQTLLVYTACALEGDAFAGLINGFAFAVLTTPSLWAAMNVHRFFAAWKDKTHLVMGAAALVVAALCLCRGLADLEIIPHLAWSSDNVHLVLY